MADAKGQALPEVAVEDAIPVLEEWKMLQPLSLQLATNAVLTSHAAQVARIKAFEEALAKSRQDHAQDVRCMSERIGRLEAVRDAAVAAVRCADTCEGPHPVSQMEIITTWEHLRVALAKSGA
jgi:hypothetical protein